MPATATSTLRCANCDRRIRDDLYQVTDGEETTSFCGDRAACLRAANDRYGTVVKLSGASDEALGSAMIASYYVPWPWWARLLPRSARNDLSREFARRLAAAVEHRVLNPRPRT